MMKALKVPQIKDAISKPHWPVRRAINFAVRRVIENVMFFLLM